MQIENLFQPYEITFKTSDDCPVGPHKHTFFELACILSGEGTHHINDNKFEYYADNMFLLMPMDSHYFRVRSTTSFMLIRFNNIFLKGQKTADQHSNLGEWIQKLEYIFQNNNHHQGCIIRNREDKPLVRAVLEAIRHEHKNDKVLHKELMQHLINTLITLVARNISLHIAEKTKVSQHSMLDMMNYIHMNIYNAEKLKAESIAAHFNISLNYISEYFKKHAGETLQQYIINYKLSLAEIRLKHSDMRLNEIAFELGFTDESHLTKTFKKYKGISPAMYRKTNLALAS
ncbi:MAG TPA: AraC family transcriptional regulator [Chitinophaga sp.]|uniref:helix-turn-helix domain-containing protein n=1 Tax=Chitinophaga sp. TaxID=1869181 RepID=UPI002CE51394|nr:AraC family transcriptional regulator [Chitinophaga sp.]HVI47644.1 AraC family transcriptional regulator [Chitinophaga sp.]